MVNFFRILHSVFYSGCITFHAQAFQFLHVLAMLAIYLFFIVTVLMGMRRSLAVVWICISLIITDVEHLFMCLYGHLYIFFREMSVQVLCSFLVFLFLSYRVSRRFLILKCVSIFGSNYAIIFSCVILANSIPALPQSLWLIFEVWFHKNLTNARHISDTVQDVVLIGSKTQFYL